jgi:hypothetical protein
MRCGLLRLLRLPPVRPAYRESWNRVVLIRSHSSQSHRPRYRKQVITECFDKMKIHCQQLLFLHLSTIATPPPHIRDEENTRLHHLQRPPWGGTDITHKTQESDKSQYSCPLSAKYETYTSRIDNESTSLTSSNLPSRREHTEEILGSALPLPL